MKNILITGASAGLGKEIALYFANNGWNVIATMINLDHGKELTEYPNIKCYQLDVIDTNSIETAKKIILQDFKTIDVIVNNAGVGYRSFVEFSEDDKINAIINVNFFGIIKVCRAFIPVFRMQKSGHFINITSIAGLVNLPLGSFYHATKHAVESFSESMAYELIDFNIKVCTVQFGNAPTGFQSNVKKSESSNIESYSDLMNKISKILNDKSTKNGNLTSIITQKLFLIANKPPKNFKRYTIGFDAIFMRTLRYVLGYRMFNRLIRQYTL